MKVSILGAGGLTGKEILRILSRHPHFECVHITSDKFVNKSLLEIFPDLPQKYKHLIFQKHSSPIPTDSLVVLAVPDEVSLMMTPLLLEKGHSIIDISGVYRIHSKEKFEKFYKLKHESFSLMDKVVYGLPEVNRENIKNAKFVSNPGCYATSVILPIFLLGELREKISGDIVISSASGVSGAGGRKEEVAYSFLSVYENFKPYRIFNHQHIPEMQEYCEFKMKTKLPEIIFTPHLLPIHSGILTDIVVRFSKEIDVSMIESQFNLFRKEPFIRFIPSPEDINLQNIQKTNFIDIGFKLEGSKLIIVSALDNLIKGAAGQAVQNMNLMTGFEETLGLL
jgi:N-acetyl-gamma-glutamyl-phosphate reductase